MASSIIDVEDLKEHLNEVGLLNEELIKAINEYLENVKPSLKIPFGKYKGHQLISIKKNDFKYLKWLVKQKWLEQFEDLYMEVHNLLDE